MAKVAVPEFKDAASSEVPSIVKVTLPVGVVDPEAGATVAVKVTTAPSLAGLALEVNVVVLPTTDALVIVSVKLLLVLVANVEVPP
jgi:hypothetical protein